MAVPQSPKSYNDLTPTHSRRSSGRRSFTPSLSRSSSYLESPRTACPKDGDAFSYHPYHLRTWYLPQEIWDRLPAVLQSTLAAVQHSGAAVLTGFERVDQHAEGFNGNHPGQKIPAVELLARLDGLPSSKPRTFSNASSFNQSEVSSPLSGSPASQSGCASPVTSYGLSLPATMSPSSPLSLGPPSLTDKRSRSRERSFSTPLDPHDQYLATEVAHLRFEAVPRLRHRARKVDTEWYEAKRTNSISPDDVDAFGKWWAEKKTYINSLNDRAVRHATELGLANTGMGWCAP